MSDQILLICDLYKNRTGIWTGKRLFLLYHCYVQYQRLQEMTIFDWYKLYYTAKRYIYSNLLYLLCEGEATGGMVK